MLQSGACVCSGKYPTHCGPFAVSGANDQTLWLEAFDPKIRTRGGLQTAQRYWHVPVVASPKHAAIDGGTTLKLPEEIFNTDLVRGVRFNLSHIERLKERVVRHAF